MKHQLAAILPGAAAVLLCACATPLATPVPAGAQRMEPGEIRTLFASPTRFDNGVRGGLTYRFLPDGTVEYGMRMMAARTTGTWRAADDGLCIRVQSDPWICGPFYRLGSGRFYFDLPRHDQDYNTLTVRE